MARKPDVPLRNGTAGGFNGQPPQKHGVAASGNSPDGLTPKFNVAAKQSKAVPASKAQIEVLKKRLSRPAHTAELTPLGMSLAATTQNEIGKS